MDTSFLFLAIVELIFVIVIIGLNLYVLDQKTKASLNATQEGSTPDDIVMWDTYYYDLY